MQVPLPISELRKLMGQPKGFPCMLIFISQPNDYLSISIDAIHECYLGASLSVIFLVYAERINPENSLFGFVA
jgi:hypothetical protein